MLKRLFFFFATSLLLISSCGCSTPYVTPIVTASDGSVIDDFYFIFEDASWTGEPWDPQQNPEIFAVCLDTKNNVICQSRGYYNFGYETISKKYYMPQERLQALYDDIIKYDMMSYSGPDVVGYLRRKDSGYFIKYTFRIHGDEYSVIADETALINPLVFLNGHVPEEYYNLSAFTALVMNVYYGDTKEFRSFPREGWSPAGIPDY